MKKIFLKVSITIIIIIASLILNCGVSNAASANITASSKEVNVGDNVTITVSVDAIAWNLKINGSNISENIVGGNMDGDELSNKKTNKTYKLDTSKSGTYTVKLSGDITDANSTSSDIGSSVTIKVNEKAEKPAETQQPTTQTPQTQTPTTPNTQTPEVQKPTTPETEKETQKPVEPSFKTVNETVYTTQTVNIRDKWSTSGNKIATVNAGQELKRTGIGPDGWDRVVYNGKTGYMINTALTTVKPKTDEDEKEEKENEEETEKSSIKTLKSLEIKGYELEPTFNPETKNYSITLNEEDEELEIEAVPEDEKAEVNISGNENFKIGNNIVKITVTAEDGTVRFYNITVTKTNEEGLVDGLKLTKLEVSKGELQPSFQPEITNYIITIEDPSTITTEDIKTMVDDENVKVSVAQNEQSEDGEKVFTIMLENKDGSKTGVYQITVKKPEQNQVMTTQGNKDNTIYYILAAIIGVLLLLIVIIIIALKKTSNKEDDEEKDDYDYSLKDAIDNVNLDEEIEENAEVQNTKSQILRDSIDNNQEKPDVEEINLDMDNNDGIEMEKTQRYDLSDLDTPTEGNKKKGKHF